MNTEKEIETDLRIKYKECVKVRKFLVDSVMRELIGPGSEQVGPDPEEEIITENPRSRYTIGMLFPQELTAEEESIQEGYLADDIVDPDKIMDEYINLTNQYYPSAMGISFYTSGKYPSLNVKVSAAKYRKMTDDDECLVFLENIPESAKKDEKFIKSFRCEKGRIIISAALIKKKEDRAYFLNLSDDPSYKTAIYKLHSQAAYGWKRVLFPKECCLVNIPEDEKKKFEKEIIEGLSLVCIRRPEADRSKTLFTVSLLNKFKNNKNDKKRGLGKIFYQVGFKISFAEKAENEFLEYVNRPTFLPDKEVNSYRLLYRKKKEYATGHGCTAGWSIGNNGLVNKLYTEIMPSFEVPHIGFDVPEINCQIPEMLFMYNLSDISSMTNESMFTGLYKFCNIYKKWISKLTDEVNKVPSELHEAAQRHIKLCESTFKRIESGVKLLEKNSTVLKAFRMANRAMFIQRIHSKLQKNKRFPGEGVLGKIDYGKDKNKHSWRPFQLAFLLLSLNSIYDCSDEERETVDLLWFATAGGKTEAYLGITAFTIFLRRLKNKDKGGGTAVIMRYTLRLLTSQQFQRAATLICACELIRRKAEQELGKGKITIGLWVGSALTPNNIEDAKKKINSLQRGYSDENPFQLLSCPWCGTKLIKERHKGKWGYRVNDRPKKFVFFCPEEKCEFNKELPVLIIDEDIYRYPPTLLFGTVDKFALMPWKKEISNIFALDRNNNLTPELIIQDELHLIEGPLGTMVGLYETAIDTLCSAKGVKPKIIVSTATIRRAAEQCLALYNRRVNQFPPSGLSIDDSFFAKEVITDKKSGRLFAGIISSGRTHTTTLVRFMATVLQAVKDADCEDKIKDHYWTLVGYYNTLRELGHNVTLVNQDVKDYLIGIADRKNIYCRKLYEPTVVELTSRISATMIPDILERLFIEYPDKEAIQVLLATNMIATGVDIDRLSLMMVAGQPKLTAEYIQATSRIGREYPGLVFTVYNGTKPRDRSHYEHFRAYHQSFYKYVEPTTVTPFSGPARDRALHAVIVTLIRHLSGFNKNNQAAEAIKNISKEDLKIITDSLIKRVNRIDSREEDNTQKDIESIIKKYREKSECDEDIVYGSLGVYSDSKKRISLLTSSKGKPGIWRTLTSMRGVDEECHIDIVE
ncbi:MAG: helicase [Candidatus Atribacteria bacterium]